METQSLEKPVEVVWENVKTVEDIVLIARITGMKIDLDLESEFYKNLDPKLIEKAKQIGFLKEKK